MWWLLAALAGGAVLAVRARRTDEVDSATEILGGRARADAKRSSVATISGRTAAADFPPALKPMLRPARGVVGGGFVPVVPTPTVTELAVMARAAIYIGPLDYPQWINELADLSAGPDTMAARARVMRIAQEAIVLGVDGNPGDVAPDPDGNTTARWNWQQVTILDAVVGWWASPLTAPGPDVRSRTAELLRWAKAMIERPPCNMVYEGQNINDVYGRNRSQLCQPRRDRYHRVFQLAIQDWQKDRGIAGVGRGWARWHRDVPAWGTDADQAVLAAKLRVALRQVGVDKMVIWPGGPPAQPLGGGGEAAVIAVLILVAVGVAA